LLFSHFVICLILNSCNSGTITYCWLGIVQWLIDNCYLTEGALQKVVGRRLTDRHVFLFDGLMILTKQNKSRISVTGPVGDYKLKEKYNVRLVDITDRDDTDGVWLVLICQSRNFFTVCSCNLSVQFPVNLILSRIDLLHLICVMNIMIFDLGWHKVSPFLFTCFKIL